MTRTGPNQDVNDPTTIIELAYEYNATSQSLGDFLAQSIAEDPSVTGSPIVDVSIPLKIEDGSSVLLYGSDITYDGTYHYDQDVVAKANILTYVGLAERFRDYWESLNAVIDSLSDFTTISETGISPEIYGSGISVFPYTRTYGTSGGISYTLNSFTHSPTSSLETPEWYGSGDTNYNQATYPQLLSELQLIEVTRTFAIEDTWETNYRFELLVDDSGSQRSASLSCPLTNAYTSVLENQYVQIYNSTTSAINISLSADVTISTDDICSLGVGSFGEIDDLNIYPDPLLGDKSLLSSYMSSSKTTSGADSLSHTRNISIPAGKSAFIGVGASVNFAAFVGTYAIVDIVVTLNGYTFSYSGNIA